jgi:ABC-2 type transport system permease protein
MNLFDLDTAWFFQHVVARSLLSVFPGFWLMASDSLQINGPDQVNQILSLSHTYSVMKSPQLWIGAVAGVAMLIGAIRLRRWRDDN